MSMSSLLSTIIFCVFLLIHSVTGAACRDSEYECTDGSGCIAQSYLCDFVPDCDNQEDEDTNVCRQANAGCSDTEYQCTDGSGCIDISALCDTFKDCTNGEDETQQICAANDVCIYSNGCLNKGYDYRCQYTGQYATRCLYGYKMCDDHPDCPNGDDEVQANCNIATPTTTTYSWDGIDGVVSCGENIIGTGEEDGIYTYNFTFPSKYTHLKITNCFNTNQGDADIALCRADDVSNCIYPDYDTSCAAGCYYRSTLLGVTDGSGDEQSNIWNVESDTQYIIGTQIYFEGTYAFKVRCGTSSYNAGGACTDSAWGTGSGFATTNYDHYPGSTYDWNYGSTYDWYQFGSTYWNQLGSTYWNQFGSTYDGNGYGSTYDWNQFGSTYDGSQWGSTYYPRRRILAAEAPFCVPTNAPTAPTTSSPTASTSSPTTSSPTKATLSPTTSNPTEATASPSREVKKSDTNAAYRTQLTLSNILFIFMSFVLCKMF